jgi:hypothetical protein
VRLDAVALTRLARAMRKDMSKIIVERPRVGRAAAGLRSGRTRVVEDDDGEPLRAGRGGRAPKRDKPQKTKRLNENLNPLRRYLQSQVERPWNKVYSEISENLKPTSTVQQHVRDHIEDFVAIKTRTRDGVVMATPRWGGERPLADDHRRFYVHPRTGLLRENPNYRGWTKRHREKLEAEAKDRFVRMREIDGKTQLHKLKDDIWWEVKLGRLGDGREPDVVLAAGLSTLAPEILYARYGARAIAKRMLNKADKKKYGL